MYEHYTNAIHHSIRSRILMIIHGKYAETKSIELKIQHTGIMASLSHPALISISHF